MTAELSFLELMEQLKRGNDTAAAGLFRRHGQQLVRLAAPDLAALLHQPIDPEDLVQAAFDSFLWPNPAVAAALNGWPDLWSLLTIHTLKRCHFRVRPTLAEQRNGSHGLERAGANAQLAWELIARDPTQDEAAALIDLVRRLLDNLEEPTRRIAELSLQGFAVAEIAPRTGVTERTVCRHLNYIRSALERMANDTDSPP